MYIKECGGEIHFNKKLSGWSEKKDRIIELQTVDGDQFQADAVILATGHSARDIFQLFQEKKKEIHAKPFALGVRVEHPQELINSIQYRYLKEEGPRVSGLTRALPSVDQQALEQLSRYPLVSRMSFVECSGNSAPMFSNEPVQANAQALHGLVSNAEWTGVPLSVLLDEAGADPNAKWVIAEGADAHNLDRSVPMKKAYGDALVAIYQNGERLMPGNGYPMRLLLPGWEGNMNVKWLRRLKVTASPMMTKDETSKYTILLQDGKAWQFVFPLEVKSVITRPSPGLALKGPGFYEISGLAWSGNGSIRSVEVSADGGKSWAPAVLNNPVLPKALTRFRAAWQWNGGPAQLQSRATDDTGMVQPSRAQFIAERGLRGNYHFNAIQTWAIDDKGEAANAYA
jgi:sulfane dehydrogenase subunit SoxC